VYQTNVWKRITAFALTFILLFTVAACQEVTTTTQSGHIPNVEEVGQFADKEELQTYLAQFYADSGNGWYSYRSDSLFGAEDAIMTTAAMTTTAAAPGAIDGADNEVDRTHSVSNDQVTGVAESDTIMTDGYYIYVVSNEKFFMIDADTLDIIYTFTMPEASYSYFYGMYLNGDHVVLLASEYTYSEQKADDSSYYYWYYYRYGTRVMVLDIADPENVVIDRNMFFENTYMIDSRMIDGYVYLIMDNYMINYGYVEDAFLPIYSDTAVSDEPIELPATNIYYMPNDNYSLCYLMLASFSVDDSTIAAHVDAYLGSTYQIYMSLNNLYTVMYRYSLDEETGWYEYTTYILRFQIFDHVLVFQAIGAIAGSPLNQYSMDEYEGAFRIATTDWVYHISYVNGDGTVVTTIPGSEDDTVTIDGDAITTTIVDTEPTTTVGTGNVISVWSWTVENRLFVLDATAVGDMPVLGSIEEGLGKPNERIFAVRFNGDVAYVVTFVNTDPLYKLDLSDPTDPQVIGAWEEEGVSDYLHPVNDDLMIGIGRQAEDINGWTRFTGVKVSLYDTTGNDPFALDTYLVEGEYSYSPITYDQKAFMYYQPVDADFWYISIPVFEYYENYWQYSQSMYVFKVMFSGELEFVAKLTHNEVTDPYNYYYDSIERSVVIGSHIYTVSYTQIQMFDMAEDFAFVTKTTLNENYRYDYWY